MADNIEFDSSLYPRTYTASFLNKLLICLLSLIVIWLLYIFLKKIAGFSIKGIIVSFVPFTFVTIAISRTFAKITLHPHNIEYRGFLTKKNVDAKNIVGTEKLGLYRRNLPVIRYNDTDFKDDRGLDKTFPLALNFKKDDAWHYWMGRFPDLDEKEDLRFLGDTSQNIKLGSNIDRRKENLDKANILGTFIKSSFLLIPIIAIYDFSYLFYYAIALQLLVIMNIYFYGLWIPTLKKKSPFNTNILALGICMMISNWYLRSPELSEFILPKESEGKAILIGLIFGLPFFYFIAKGCSGSPKLFYYPILLVFFLMESFFGTAIAMNINTSYDSSIAVKQNGIIFPITGKRKVLLSVVGKKETEVIMDIEDYNKMIWIRQDVCVESHSGFLGIEWYKINLKKCDL
jgi:hypothetical protein